MKVTIETVDHATQRYPTTGDYFWTDAGDLLVKVSNMGDWKYEMLVGVHEVIEALLCKNNGIPEPKVVEFDLQFERVREAMTRHEKAHFANAGGMYAELARDPDAEPGDSNSAPYRNEHCFATAVERMLCAALGISWNSYERKNLELYDAQSPQPTEYR